MYETISTIVNTLQKYNVVMDKWRQYATTARIEVKNYKERKSCFCCCLKPVKDDIITEVTPAPSHYKKCPVAMFDKINNGVVDSCTDDTIMLPNTVSSTAAATGIKITIDLKQYFKKNNFVTKSEVKNEWLKIMEWFETNNLKININVDLYHGVILWDGDCWCADDMRPVTTNFNCELCREASIETVKQAFGNDIVIVKNVSSSTVPQNTIIYLKNEIWTTGHNYELAAEIAEMDVWCTRRGFTFMYRPQRNM